MYRQDLVEAIILQTILQLKTKNAFKLGEAWRRVSRMVRGMESLFYERSLYKLNLLSLGKQRLGGYVTTLENTVGKEAAHYSNKRASRQE